MGLDIPPLVALTSCQVPPVQFQHFSGIPPRLANTHVLTNLTMPSLPPNIQALVGAFAAETAIASPLGAGVISGINSSISSVTGSVTGMISGVIGQLDGGPTVMPHGANQALADLQGMASSMAGAGISAIESQINSLVAHLPTIGGLMTAASAIVSSLGLPSIPSFSTTFAPFTNGTLSAAVGAIGTAATKMTSALGGGLAAAAGSLGALTSGFNSAIGSVTNMLNGITSGVNSAVSTFMHLSNAAATAGMNAINSMFSSLTAGLAADFNSVMKGVSTPSLQIVVPNVTGIGTSIMALQGAVAGTVGAITAVADAIDALTIGAIAAVNSVTGTINYVISSLIRGAEGAVAAAIGAMNSLIALGADITGALAAAINGLENGLFGAIDAAIAALQDGLDAATSLLQSQSSGGISALQGGDFTTAQTTATAALLTLANASSTFLTANSYSYGIATGTSTATAITDIGITPGTFASGSSTMHAIGSANVPRTPYAIGIATGIATGLASVMANCKGTATGSCAVTAITSITPPTRNWYDNPGQDKTFWVTPFQTTATWITSGPLVNALRNGTKGSPTGVVYVVGNNATPWVVGRASDPLVTVTDGTKTIQVHIPLGTVPEAPYTSTTASIGGADVTQPYLVWSITGAQINTGSVKAAGSVITGTRDLCIDDGAGPIMCDAITGQPGTNNSLGAIQDSDLTLANAVIGNSLFTQPYVIPHMLAYALDPSQCNSGAAIWPLLVIDENVPATGGLNQGYTIGIPISTPRPAGKSNGFYLLFDNLQQYGWVFSNVSNAGCLSIDCYSTNSANTALAADVAASINAVMPYVCILSNQTGIASIKGAQEGGTNAFAPPPLLDLSPTGGVNVAPATFGAWYPSGWNITP